MLNKLERKFGRYAISNFMYYIIIINIVGVVIGIFAPGIYNMYLSLDIEKIFHGQIWRLFTFIFWPRRPDFFLLLELYLYYMIGNTLENVWGAFRFNVYYISGLLFTILGTVILYFATGYSMAFGLTYINQSLFLAFAAMFPEMTFHLFFMIPIKAKFLGILYGALIVFDVLTALRSGGYGIALAVAIICAMANFLIFFFSTRNYKKVSPKEVRRRHTYKKEVNKAAGATRHKCAVCGRTELDDENLEFRFCSKCDGNYEYCTEHLFTHNHVHK